MIRCPCLPCFNLLGCMCLRREWGAWAGMGGAGMSNGDAGAGACTGSAGAPSVRAAGSVGVGARTAGGGAATVGAAAFCIPRWDAACAA